ncbi:hypothetical protein BSY239_3211 [Hydrogenophaga sp. RAC07]|nr:hypothetical protein BSY239_3211 [Hydrogenophaga sp. RAC07]
MSRRHPLRRFAASPSLAFGGRGTAPEAWQSQILGAPGRGHAAPTEFFFA